MFSSGGNTGYSVPASDRLYRNAQTQEEREKKQAEIEALQAARTKLIKKAAMDMFTHPLKLKNCLEEAILAYLEEIKDEWFCQSERNKAVKLLEKISQANTQLISVLTEAVNTIDNFDLGKSIFNKINLHFCDKKLYAALYVKNIIAELNEIKLRQDKSSLCYAGFYSVKSIFNCLPREVIREITTKLNMI